MKKTAAIFESLAGVVLLTAAFLPLTAVAQAEWVLSDRAQEVIESSRGERVDLIITYRGRSGADDAAAATAAGASIRRDLPIINGHAISVPAHAAARLIENNPNIAHASIDETLDASYYTVGSASVGVNPLSLPTPVMHAYPYLSGLSYTGSGVAVAVIDTGMRSHPDGKPVAKESFVAGEKGDDNYGHGNHVAGIIAGSGSHSEGPYRGVAPGAEIVAARALDRNGAGQASDVIAALSWVVQNKDQYGVRVVNLSLGHPIYESVETDPLVKAVEAAWQAGLVVVASAGNMGDEGYGTITSPGNAPSIITVGSVTHWGDDDPLNDIVSTYSSRGPTRGDLIMKPDLVAPGNRMISMQAKDAYLPKAYPKRLIYAPGKATAEYFQLSGTSMAAAVVSGAAALLLEKEPGLNPATVKARLMRSADKTAFPDAFAVGAGLLNIEAALNETGYVTNAPSPRAKRDDGLGMIGFQDTAILWGDPQWALKYLWSEGYLWAEGYLWSNTWASDSYLLADGYLWSEGYLWAEGYLWSEGYLWAEGYLWSQSYPWPDSDLYADGYLWSNGYLWANGAVTADMELVDD